MYNGYKKRNMYKIVAKVVNCQSCANFVYKKVEKNAYANIKNPQGG